MDREGTSGRLRVLVIEDDDSVARMLAICLGSAGFDVARATSGGEALTILESEPPQAVILDLSLPDSLGGAVLDQLRALDPRGSPVWVAVSALDRREITRRYGPLGGRFFPKPLNPWEVVRTLERLWGARCGQSGSKSENT